MTTKALATRQAFSIVPGNMSEAIQLSNLIAKSGLAPKGFVGKPDDVLIAIMMGGEIGLAPMQALQNIAVINGRPTIWGDAVTTLVYQHPDLEWIKEWFDDPTNPQIAYCQIKRKGNEPHTREFSMKDASKAGLLAKDPWQKYPADMLKNRARKAIWDKFPDALKGLSSREEVEDTITESVTIKDVTPTNQGAKILEKIGAPIIEAVPEPTVPFHPEEVVTVFSEEEKKAVEAKEITVHTFDPHGDGNNKLYAIITDWFGNTKDANTFIKKFCPHVKKMSDFYAIKEEDRKLLWDELRNVPRETEMFKEGS